MNDAAAGYDLVLPPGWWVVPAEPVAGRESIRALLDRKFAGQPRDTVFAVRAEMERRLDALVEQAVDLGAVDVFLTVDAIAGVPVSASCLVLVVPGGDEPVPLDALAARMAADADESGVVDVAGAPALRLRRRRLPAPGRDDELPATVVEHVVPVPGSTDHVAFVWSVPVEQIADQFVALFDAIIGTLHWRWPDDSASGTGPGAPA